MGLFQNFPWTNFHDLNLDWILEELKTLKEQAAYSPENPPPYPVTSINGKTGAVVLFTEQEGVYIRFPDSDNNQWNIYRLVNGVPAGIQFSATLPAKRMQGAERYAMYDEGNPPPYPVTSVNGKTGAVVLFSEHDGAYIQFPDSTLPQWNVYRIIDEQTNGIQFHKNGAAVRMQGNNRFAIYDAGNPPPYPVTSVNGATGAVETPFMDHTDDILDFIAGAVGASWGLKRSINTGTADETDVEFTLQVNDTTGNPEAYIASGETVKKLLTEDDIPSSSGVVSVNGNTGVVVVTGENTPMEAGGQQTVAQAISAEAQARQNADTSLNDNITNLQNGLAYIVGNTNTTGATLAAGQFVYVKGHATIPDGLRKVTASISANGSITTNNTEACTEGGLNALNSKITTLYNGPTIDAINVDLNTYHTLIFVMSDSRHVTITQDAIPNSRHYGLSSFYASDAIPIVIQNICFLINENATGIYIDTTQTKQLNINSDLTIGLYQGSDLSFKEVYGISK